VFGVFQRFLALFGESKVLGRDVVPVFLVQLAHVASSIAVVVAPGEQRGASVPLLL
jgi:hypothetical protein